MKDFNSKLYETGIVPVVVLEKEEDALPLAEAMRKGGINCAEVTFRTSAAKASIQKMHETYPDMLVGAGTVLSTKQVDEALESGASFIVSPGFDAEVVDYCIKKNVPVLPGIVSPSELAQAVKRGLEVVKFFPAENYGGLKTIKSLAAAYTHVRFMPTGGINASNVTSYLEDAKIIACGGSWMVKSSMIQNHEFEKITTLCKEASDIVKKVRG